MARWATLPCPGGARGAAGVRIRRCLPLRGKGAAEWRAGSWCVAEGSRVLERFAYHGGFSGAPGGRKHAALRSMRPPSPRNHPAGGTAGSARTRPRDQSLGYPFLGNRPTSPPSPRPPKRRRRQVPARGLAAVCTLTAPPETQRSIHAPCSWGMDASSRSRRRWLPALPAWHHPSTADTGARPALYASMPSMLPALPLKAMLYHLSP